MQASGALPGRRQPVRGWKTLGPVVSLVLAMERARPLLLHQQLIIGR